jgi:hypothetical protein
MTRNCLQGIATFVSVHIYFKIYRTTKGSESAACFESQIGSSTLVQNMLEIAILDLPLLVSYSTGLEVRRA